jgi:hypothetical protein
MRRKLRYALPMIAAAVCLIAAVWTGPIVAFILIMAAFILLLDAATAMFESAGRTGTLEDHRQ